MMIKDVELTEQDIVRLSQFSPIPVNNTFDYVPLVYRECPTSIWPIFELEYVGGLDLMTTEDRLRGKSVIEEGKYTQLYERGAFCRSICLQGIKGWKNYYSLETGEEVKYDPNDHEGSLQKLPQQLLTELTNAITERQTLSEEEKLGLK